MPVPIQRIHENTDKTSSDSNFFIDYSLLVHDMPKESKRVVTASDEDAELLVRFWTTADKVSEEVYKVTSSKVSNDDILRLKAHGFLTGSSEEVKFTGKGKAVITTMALGENNAFTKEQKKRSYAQVVANMSLKGKKGYRIPKFAANSNLIRVIADLEVEEAPAVVEIIQSIKEGKNKYFGYSHFSASNMADYTLMKSAIEDLVSVYNISYEDGGAIVQALTHPDENATGSEAMCENCGASEHHTNECPYSFGANPQ